MSSTTTAGDKEQPLIQHLLELRTRIIRASAVIFAVFACLFYFASDIYEFISEPLRVYLPEGTSMIATDVASPFLAPFKLTLVLSMFLAIPYILHQIWAFISPGLYKHEKRLAIPLLTASVALFYSGMAFAYFVVFPLVFGFFTSIGPESVAVMTDINSYLNFILKLFFAFGLAFEIPVATVLLIWSGATDVDSLAKKRPYIIVGCFVMGMLLTPPDVISQTLLAGPMWFLFEMGILFARLNPAVRSENKNNDNE
ncbi:twin arginine-targeting protein translocase TatC [Endozoicomonas sp. (ex Bugula neritina AB1)]|nr:twin arginine-targeting protein translocase TatC [Endozoicomonas sp. (ex Bugula neritina AB1)]